MKETIISVIVPVYNVEPYIEKCIESVLNQSFENLELILVNDGSPDRSGKICEDYAKKDSRIKVVHKENGGLSDARNRGLQIAKGEYIFFLDSDDYIAPKALEVLYKRIREDDADISISNFLYINQNDDEIRQRNIDMPVKDELLSRDEMLEKLTTEKYWYFVVAWGKLYRRNLWMNYKFPVGKIHEDEFVCHYIVNECDKVSCIQEPLYYYVQRNDSIMGNGFSIKNLDFVEALFDRVYFAIKHGKSELAQVSVSFALGVFIQGYCKLDGSEKAVQDRLSSLYKQYKELFSPLIRVTTSKKMKVKLYLFFLNPKLYSKIIGRIRNI